MTTWLSGGLPALGVGALVPLPIWGYGAAAVGALVALAAVAALLLSMTWTVEVSRAGSPVELTDARG